MDIQIDLHTLERAKERGASEAEIKEVIDSGFFIPAKRGRLGKAKIYTYQQQWRGVYYDQKRVEVIYIIESDVAVTITVYVFYGTWENNDANPL